jgi:hypothetical protein
MGKYAILQFSNDTPKKIGRLSMQFSRTVALVIIVAGSLSWSGTTVAGDQVIPQAPPATQSDNGIQTLTDYFDFLSSGNLESAGLIWTEAAQERSARFGITYTDIPLRVDCTSPITRNVDMMRPYLRPACRQAQALGNGFGKLEYNNIINGRTIKWNYYSRLQGRFFWLTFPEDCYSHGWPVVESKYFRIHAAPDKKAYLNPAALAEADQFVARIADSLKLTKAAMAEIAAKKIEYFFCDNTETVTNMTGQNTRGILDLASNDVISTDFPHFHEIVHLMVNIKLKELPLNTLPLLREGLAVRYGGRWGKSPSALMDLGAYLYNQKLVEIDSILTVSGFNSSAGADIAYPVAGDFCLFLTQRLGMAKFFALYLGFSRSDDGLDTLSTEGIQKTLYTALGKADWTSVVADFEKFLADALPLMAGAQAGNGTAVGGKALMSGPKFQITQDNAWLNFEFSVDSTAPCGSLLFGKDARLGTGRSFLWDEQFGVTYPFEGFRYAVRFDQNEAGLYDYATNELIAKYIFGISSTEGYYDAVTGKVRVRFRSSLLGKTRPTGEDYRCLPK